MTDVGKNVLSGTFTGTGVSTSIPVFGWASVLIEGLIATVQLERSTNGGTDFFVVSIDETGAPAAYTAAGDVAFNGRLFESESQVLYRFRCTAHTTDVNYRLAN